MYGDFFKQGNYIFIETRTVGPYEIKAFFLVVS